jgi:hypothetical protein
MLVLLLFVLLTALRLHGYSLSWWHQVIDGSPAPEVLLGEPRAIRADDWKNQLPISLGQRRHEPPFPLVNRDIGLGQNMLAPAFAPVAHPLILFRPTQWGFFLGDDVGVAWLWWSQALGLFAAWTAVLAVLTRGNLVLAAGGGLLLLCAPLFQFWSLVGAAHSAFAATCLLAARGVLRSRRRRSIAGWALLLGWAGGAFAFSLYPPYQVALVYLVLALAVCVWLEPDEHPWRRDRGFRLAALLAAGAVTAGAALWLATEIRDVIELMRNTAYPGRRFSSGGDRTLPELAASALGLPLVTTNWGLLLNVCEASSFLFTFPVVGAAMVRAVRRGERPDRACLLLLVFCVAFTVYAVVGVPEWLAGATGLRFVPGRRAVIALGIADVALLVRFLALRPPGTSGDRVFALATGAVWALAIAAAGLALRASVPGLPVGWLLGAAAVQGVLAAFLLASPRPALALGALVAVSFASTCWFNPVARGGTDYLVSNPLSQQILAIDREAGGGTRWAAFGADELGNLFRILGVAAVNGHHPTPQFELWRPLDPDDRARHVINRHSQIGMVASAAREPVFRLISIDTWFVDMRPEPERLRALGVTHVLVRVGNPALFERLAPLERLASIGDNHLYRVPGPPEGER